ncbi:MAG: hypothetical protein LJE84_04440 [Gammaproteobacteria bacterium]|nr:hypothetical protein [Gammaproteobacteria bacterium]
MDASIAARLDGRPGTLARLMVALRRHGVGVGPYSLAESDGQRTVRIPLNGSLPLSDELHRQLAGLPGILELSVPGFEPDRLANPERLEQAISTLEEELAAPPSRARLDAAGESLASIVTRLADADADWDPPLTPAVLGRATRVAGLARHLCSAWQKLAELGEIDAPGARSAGLASLHQELRIAQLSCQPAAAGLWSAANALFRDGVRSPDGDRAALRQSYKEILLTGLLRCDYFSAFSQRCIHTAMPQLAAVARLRHAAGKIPGTGRFAVCLGEDHAPLRWNGQPDIELILDTRPLLARLKTEDEQREAGAAGELFPGVPVAQARFLARGLMRQLGDFRERAWPRENTERPFQVLHGFSAVVDMLSGRPTPKPQEWVSVDESLFGLQLSGPCVDLDGPVRAGELLLLRPADGDDSWILGVTRWARADPERIHVGVFKLGTGARAMQGRPAQANGVTGFEFALLPPLPGVGRGARCVVPAGIYTPPGILAELDGEEHLLVAREAPRGNHLVEWFEVAGSPVSSA